MQMKNARSKPILPRSLQIQTHLVNNVKREERSTSMSIENKRNDPGQAPIAFGRPTTRQPLSFDELSEAIALYANASVGQQWAGPWGFCEDGTPWIVVITGDARRPEKYKKLGRLGFIAWRWNATPSCPLTLTAVGGGEQRPFARWMAHDRHPVVDAIRRRKKFLACVAHSGGARSGWFEEVFEDIPASDHHQVLPSATLLDELWTFARAGIPGSVKGVRYDPFPPKRSNSDSDEEEEPLSEPDEIALWEEPVSDFWHTLNSKGPWDGDLDERDEAICAWARAFHYKRWRMAGFIQVIKEAQKLDGAKPIFREDCSIEADGTAKEQVERLLKESIEIRSWLLAIAGPSPCAERAHEAAMNLVREPISLLRLFRSFGLLGRFIGEDAAQALQLSLATAFLDHSVTEMGTKRPWLQNTPGPGLTLRTITLPRSCAVADLETMWRSAIEPDEMIDVGDWLRPSDMPAPLATVNNALECVRLEGSVEEAKLRVRELLVEAHEARQWSIPWGARVQITFGPFVAMRIYERQGEFSCLFLDQNERYLHVAVGLWSEEPQMSEVKLVRHADDSGETLWNDDAAVSLQLITAAILRDFMVVEERETVFSARPYRKRIAGRDVRTVVYLPRVRYDRIRRDSEPQTSSGSPHRVSYTVGHHFRKAASASAAQRFLAQRFGITIPEGFTFVKPHTRGGPKEAEAIKVYRSRSASRMLFEEVATAPAGTRPAWFDFEKSCARLLQAQGMTVVHQAAQRDGDGGVDLFATEADGASWVIQCKCWAPHRPVGPEVIRELVGTIERVDRGGNTKSRGMIITTSTLTRGAADEASALGFKVVEGTALVTEMQKASL
ncbi:restriction endonuclease [Variovorax sp.]|jgi:hypothetical protein|uniref:restriction endonuclease n=1 Tax=Variovorax sp. TaxID=1871043 RepID=UPI0037DA6A5E